MIRKRKNKLTADIIFSQSHATLFRLLVILNRFLFNGSTKTGISFQAARKYVEKYTKQRFNKKL